MKKILVINGPNMSMLGKREVQKYGKKTLSDLYALLEKHAKGKAKLTFCQSNAEGELLSFIHENYEDCDGIIINAAAYTHTSVALADALSLTKKPYVEVHITNVHAREEFRHHSYISAGAVGVVCGLGFDGYVYALDHLTKEA